VAETWDPRHRGKGGALMQMGLPLGSMLAIGTAAAVASITGGLNSGGWRVLYALGALPALIVFLLARKTPESPLWLRRAARPGAGLRGVFAGGDLRGIGIALGFVFFCQYIYWGVFTWTPTFLISKRGKTPGEGAFFASPDAVRYDSSSMWLPRLTLLTYRLPRCASWCWRCWPRMPSRSAR